jgi:hypothetical protein
MRQADPNKLDSRHRLRVMTPYAQHSIRAAVERKEPQAFLRRAVRLYCTRCL